MKFNILRNLVKIQAEFGGDNIPGDYEDRKPKRERVRPLADGQGDDRTRHEELVGDGIENPPETGSLIEQACDEPIDSVTDRGEGKNDDCRPSPGLFRGAGCVGGSVLKTKPNEKRDGKEPGYGDLIGQREVH